MKTRVIAAFTSVVAVTALLAACSPAGSTSKGDDTLTIGLASAIDSWNPQEAVATSSFSVFPQVFGSLLSTSPDGTKLVPGLSTKYEFDDAAKTITFHLDPKAKFSDGSDVTPDDVIYSEGLWAAGELYGSYFISIDSVSATDDDTVVFNLKQPDHAMLGILATSNAAIVPKDLGGVDAKTFWKKPISAGAYAIESEEVGETISLKSNKYFTENKDRPAKVKYSVVTDSAQQLLQFQSGKVDVVNVVETSAANQYDQSKLKSVPSSGVSTLMFQTAVAPFDNVNFRKGIALAINHKELISGGYAGLGVQANSVLPQTVPGVAQCADCDWGKSDLAEAKKLIAASGYDGSSITLGVISGPGADGLAAQALAPMLKAAGVTATVAPMAESAFVDKLSSGDFQMGVITYNALAPSPLDPLGFLAATGNLFTQSDVAPANTAIEGLAAATDDKQIEAATSGFESAMFQTVPLIPLAVPNAIYAVSDRVKGFVPNVYRSWMVKDLTLQ